MMSTKANQRSRVWETSTHSGTGGPIPVPSASWRSLRRGLPKRIPLVGLSLTVVASDRGSGPPPAPRTDGWELWANGLLLLQA